MFENRTPAWLDDNIVVTSESKQEHQEKRNLFEGKYIEAKLR